MYYMYVDYKSDEQNIELNYCSYCYLYSVVSCAEWTANYGS